MLFADRLTLDAPRRTKEGFLAVRAKAARSGVYDYLGREVDPKGKHFKADQVVKVYRPESEVFDARSVGSFLMKPITNDHPSVPVTADNWKQHARGVVGKALRDGDHLAFDLVVMDSAAIEAVDSGKRELSNGYACDLAIEDGTAPDGTAYQAVQRNISGNHVALVDRGRAGSTCRIGDTVALCDALTISDFLTDQENVKMPHTLMIDGLQVVEVSDSAKAAIEKLQSQIADANTAKDKALADVATLTTDKSTLVAEKATLEKQIADSKMTPQQLRDAGKAYQAVVAKAKALGVTVSDEMDEAAIQKAVVSAKLGDAAKDWNDVQIAASFATLTKDAKPAEGGATVILTPTVAHDAASVRDAARAMRAA